MTMSIKIASPNFSVYKIATPVYEGSLDLLLQLIEKAELDITKLALAQVTDQYLEHLKTVQERSPEELSSFLVIAARLIQIKSEALLPRHSEQSEGEEDPGEALARQLREYKRYRQVAEMLSQREKDGLHSHIRLAPIPYIEPTVDIGDVDVFDLMDIARYFEAMEAEMESRPSIESVVTAPRITIRKKISLIANCLKMSERATFRSLFGKSRSRIEIVVTFLAMLELVKRYWVIASQDQLFGEIHLEITNSWGDDDRDIDLEFGE